MLTVVRDLPTPPTLQTVERRRISWRVVSIAVLFVLLEGLRVFVQPELAGAFQDPYVRLTTLGVFLLGAAVYALHRYQLVSSFALTGLLLAVSPVVAFAIAFVETSVPLAPEHALVGISGVGVWILLVCVLLPSPPMWALASALAAASTWPLAFVINAQRFASPWPPWERLLAFGTTNALIAVVGWLIRRQLSGRPNAEEGAPELGSYRLLERIGEGGMGEVWKASHQMLARRAAIKLVRPSAVSFSRQPEMWTERFRREANAIARLQSAHTIYLYDFGVSGSGRFYYVMELLDGISLETLVAKFGPQPAARVRFILQQICESLDEAHQQTLVHRDLKPSNVMLCKHALTHDFVKVLDFGLAKCAACEDLGQLTVEGTTAGTPGYMAPEVVLGEAEVDGRADVYALGCVAYFLLTGTLVFPDLNPMAMALKHVRTTPDPPSTRTELFIPAELERVVMHCLEKNPADRPASVADIAERLRRCDFQAWTPADAAAWWQVHLPASSSLRSTARELTAASASH